MNHIIEEVFQNNWLIHKDIALSYLPQLISYLNGNKLEFNSEELIQRNKPYIINNQTSIVGTHDLEDIDIPENSIAVIPIVGIIRKYGYYGTQELINKIALAEQNPQIIAILFYYETGGGMVTNTDIAAEAIKNCTIPTIAFASGIVASAGMWLYSASNYRIIQSKLDSIGSIGTMVQLADYNGFYEKYGINIYEIYATLSTKKNNEIRELFDKQNDKPMIESLDFVNAEFHSVISRNLNIKSDSEVFTGELYYAERGIELGLANEINSFDYAVAKANELGLAKAINTQYVNSN